MAVLKYHDGTGWEPVASALQGPTGPTGVAVGLPTGGATGASLIKSSSTDYATEWSSNVGGLIHINTTSFSAVASQSINDVFSATYDNYFLLIDIVGSTNLALRTRLRVGGADDTGTNYFYQKLLAFSTTTGAEIQTNQAQWQLADVQSQRTTVETILTRPFLAESTGIRQTSVFRGTVSLNGGDHNQSTSYTGFSLICSTGNITGTVQVFGYKD